MFLSDTLYKWQVLTAMEEKFLLHRWQCFDSDMRDISQWHTLFMTDKLLTAAVVRYTCLKELAFSKPVCPTCWIDQNEILCFALFELTCWFSYQYGGRRGRRLMGERKKKKFHLPDWMCKTPPSVTAAYRSLFDIAPRVKWARKSRAERQGVRQTSYDTWLFFLSFFSWNNQSRKQQVTKPSF